MKTGKLPTFTFFAAQHVVFVLQKIVRIVLSSKSSKSGRSDDVDDLLHPKYHVRRRKSCQHR